MLNNNQCCGSCKFWLKNAVDVNPTGECRRHPPTTFVRYGKGPLGQDVTVRNSFYPVLSAKDPGCGEFELKLEIKDETRVS